MNAQLLPLHAKAMEGRSEKDLLTACANGDIAALGALYDRLHMDVWRFSSRLLGAGNAEIDDLVQATFIEVWKSAKRFSGRSSPKVWIFGITHNLARRIGRDRARKKRALATLSTLPTAETPTPDRQTDDRMMIDRLAVALETLTPNQRVAFVMCDLEDVPGVEAAKALGIRPGTLWRRLHDARKALRQALEETP